ncbi:MULTISPECIES: hypothetical protein [unclassified Brevundimonas]|jgi:hypothetical protein|uniref:hypothetical protein n=1 Tax=unclassified Brevundimonas TaxID=2622653 RepID=UPI000C384C31|nr:MULTISPECIES: hypothetical protein [unclassified Brevundimonas]MAL87534.1 hypothetical protein [Brevundimonas sp.]HAV49731.1 hypothetical protein [Brevundimonas sp.]|tara:strand:- start:20865 stop:21296 length:432 start_codon:yes stop_codon:yes gene_type:complete
MFGFADKETPETARLIFLRSQEIGRRFLDLPFDEAGELVKRNFAPEHCYVTYNHIGMTYAELPDFSFNIMDMVGSNSLTIFGGGKYDGFMLQRDASGDRLHIDVEKPISRPLGPKAVKLATFFQKNYGATNPRETVKRALGVR